MRLLLFFTPLWLFAQTGLDRPNLGQVIDRQGSLRSVSGVAGSFVLGTEKARGVFATACSQTLCIAKLRNSILIGDAVVTAPPGPAVLAVNDSQAAIYFSSTHQFAILANGVLSPLDLALQGELTSLRFGASGFDLAVRRADGIRIVTSGGATLDFLPTEATTALLLSAAVVYATAEELVLRRADGSEQRFPAEGVHELFAMGDGWVEARSAKSVFALRTGSGRETLYVLPQASDTQFMLYSVNGTTETPVGSTFQVGSVAGGDSKDTRFRARNAGPSAVTVSNILLSGAGFTITQTPSPPFVIAPGSFQDIYVHFAGTTLASYSANFQLVYGANSISVLLLATVIAAPSLATVSTGTGCTGPDSTTNAISFGSIQSGQTVSCAISLRNPGTQSLTISSVAITGAGFQLAAAVPTPIVLEPGGSSTFSVNFVPSTAAVYSGTLSVDTRGYPLSGTAFTPSLPTPILEFDAGPPASAQQRTLTMRLPSPAPVAASGSVLLSFQPGTNTVSDDPAVVFVATGARSVPFSIKAGDTQFTLGGQPGAVFQTGTTFGKITFSIPTNVTISGTASASMTIPATPMDIDTANATRRAGDLDIQVWGYDNTYSAGAMSFTFYDLAGNMVQLGAVSADFSSQFRSYFTSSQAGSSFQMRVSFPVTGDSGQIGAVAVKLTNSAGTVSLQRLNFQ